MRLGILASLLIASGAYAQAPSDEPSANVPQAPTATAPAAREIIPLYMSAKRVLVMLRVGDSPPVPVVFDTGTNGNAVDLKLADRLGLPRVGPSVSVDGSTGKPVPGYESFIKNARLSGVALPDARATALVFDNTDEIGIFGPNSFPDRLVEMDGPKSRLVVRAKTAETIPQGPGTPYLGQAGDDLPAARVDFDGLEVTAILDTGNDVPIILPMTYIDKLVLQAPPVRIGFAVSAAGRQPLFSARLKGVMHIGPVTLAQPEIRFMEGGRPNIGLPILRKLSVVYDYSKSQSWILPTELVLP